MPLSSYDEASRQISEGKSVDQIDPSLREYALDIEAIKFQTNCALAGLNPNKVAAAYVKSLPVVSLDSYRFFASRS